MAEPQHHTTDPTVAQTLTARIEDLYGAPLAALEAHVAAHPRDSMLAALTGSRTDLELAERNIAFQLARLRELVGPGKEIGRFTAGHILDCARRISESVATRDAYAKSLSSVLSSLHRVPAPESASEPTPSPPTAPPVPAPAPASATPRTR
ncbi:hypothetical protein [Streptomyces sp. NPDC003077]|uniref:hypothetical protein n=1 Tax=Streptomyces sp. NPDC003077 TaxID=3154443 RepID=UPI0033B4DB7A